MREHFWFRNNGKFANWDITFVIWVDIFTVQKLDILMEKKLFYYVLSKLTDSDLESNYENWA